MMTVAWTAVGERNLATLARHQPELVDRPGRMREEGEPAISAPTSTAEPAWWISILDSSTPGLIFAADVLLRDPPFHAIVAPAVLVVVERQAERRHPACQTLIEIEVD